MPDLPIPGRLKPATPGNKVADLTDITDGGSVYEQADDGTYALARVPRNRTLTVDSIAKLRTALANGVEAEVYRVRWHTTRGDKGGGKFLPVDAGEDNNGTIIAGGSLVVQRDCVDINVRMFGAQGNATGVTGVGADDTAAFVAAIAALPATGGTLFVPDGQYRTTGGLALRAGVRIRGTNRRISGACKVWLDGHAAKLFTIGELCNDVTIERIGLQGIADPASATDTYGIYASGSYPNSSIGFELRNCSIYKFGTGFGVESLASEWQFDNVILDHTQIYGCLRCIWVCSQNATYWSINACALAFIGDGGLGLHIERGGSFHITATAGGGNDASGNQGSCFVRLGVAGFVDMTSCQSESVEYSMILDDVPDGHAVNLRGCIHDGKTDVRGNRSVYLYGGRYGGGSVGTPFILSGSDARVYNYGAIVSAWDIRNSSQVVTDGVKSRRSAGNPDGFPFSVSEYLLTTTAPTQVLTAIPSPAGLFRVSVAVRVANAATTVGVELNANPIGGGGKYQLLFPGAPLEVGQHSLGSWLVSASTLTGDLKPIELQVTALTANNVYVSAVVQPET